MSRVAQADTETGEAATAGADAVQPFIITSQDLPDALNAFAAQSGAQVRFDADALTGTDSNAIEGSVSGEEALRRLLSGTGYNFSRDEDGAFVIESAAAEADDADELAIETVEVEAAAPEEAAEAAPAEPSPAPVAAVPAPAPAPEPIEEPFAELPPVESPVGPVDGYLATRSLTGTRIDAPLEEQPVSVQVLPGQIIEDVQATRVDDVVTFATGASKANNFGGLNDSFLLRGLEASVAEDGVITDDNNFQISQARDSANVERVEVLRGPGSALYGQGGPGGVVNIVTKRPDATRSFAEAEASYSTFERARGEFDINAPIVDGFAAMRIVGTLEGTDSFRFDDAFDDTWPSDRKFIAPSFLIGQGTDTRLLVSGEYLFDQTPFDRGIVTDEDGNPLISTEQFLGDPDTGPVTSQKIKLRTELEHDLNEDWSVRATGTYLDNEIVGEAVEPRARIDQGILDLPIAPGFTIETLQQTRALFFPDSPPPSTGLPPQPFSPDDVLEDGDILRLFRDRDQEDELLSGRLDLNGIVRTGFLTHNLLFSAEYASAEGESRIDQTDDAAAFVDAVSFGRGSVTVLNGDTLDLSNAPGQADVNTINLQDEELDTAGFVINNKIDIGEQIHVLLGGRYDIIDQNVRSETFVSAVPPLGGCADGADAPTCGPASGSPDVIDIQEEKFSPRAGLVVEPFANTPFSLFFSYTEGIRANKAKTPTGSVDPNETVIIPPQEFTAYEGGLRYGFLDNRLAFTATVFSIEVDNFPLASASGGQIASTVESEGVELNLQGSISPEWSILANYAYTDAVVTDGPALVVGTQQPGSPEHSASLLSKYQFLDGPYRGFFGTLGLVYQDDRVNSIPQNQNVGGVTIAFEETRVPEFVRLDLSAGYEFESGSVFEIGVQNALDEDILRLTQTPGVAQPELPVTGFVRFKGKF